MIEWTMDVLSWPTEPWRAPTYGIGAVLMGILVSVLFIQTFRSIPGFTSPSRVARAVILVIACALCWPGVPLAAAIEYYCFYKPAMRRMVDQTGQAAGRKVTMRRNLAARVVRRGRSGGSSGKSD